MRLSQMKNNELYHISALSPEELSLAILEADKARAQDVVRYFTNARDWSVRVARNSINYIQQHGLVQRS